MSTQAAYLAYIRAGYDASVDQLDRNLAVWRQQFTDGANNPQFRALAALFGFSPPTWPTALAAIAAFIYQHTGQQAFAEQARRILIAHREWTAEIPRELVANRPEYSEGIPPLEPVFQPLVFIPACERISSILTETDRQLLAEVVASSFRTVFRFPEWGGHNRAMLRAAGLALAARAFPQFPEATQWADLSDELAEESWGRWSLEDSLLYLPHWLRSLFIYAEARGRTDVAQFIEPRLYLRAAVQLLTPMRNLPDYGDAHWLPSRWEWLQCFEWGAGRYADPAMKWAAARMWDRLRLVPPTVSSAIGLIAAHDWCKDVAEQEPGPAVDALDDLVMKKIVFRSGHDEDATYLCLNYRDEGDYGRISRDYLRTTLAVSAEKMHHGHSDENSVAMLMSHGCVLLHESGYREAPPDGIYRSDLYHNRLVWRNGIKPATQGLLDYLHDNGHYHPVRSERLYWTRLLGVEISRTRITDEPRGLRCDRTIFYLPPLHSFVVIDTAQALRAGSFTLAALWWTTDVLARGSQWFDTQIPKVQEWTNRASDALLIAFPGANHQDVYQETFRRAFQQETLLARSWTGHLHAAETVSCVTVLQAHPTRPSGSSDDESATSAGAVQIVPSDPRGVAVSVEGNGESYLLATLQDLTSGWINAEVRPRYTAEHGSVSYGKLTSDAAFAMIVQRAGKMRAGFINGTHLEYGGQALYEGQQHAMFQEDATARNGIPARFRWES